MVQKSKPDPLAGAAHGSRQTHLGILHSSLCLDTVTCSCSPQVQHAVALGLTKVSQPPSRVLNSWDPARSA